MHALKNILGTGNMAKFRSLFFGDGITKYILKVITE